MSYTPGPWIVEPLTGAKYYGTRVRIGTGFVDVWTSNPGKASQREVDAGWSEGDTMDHVETDTDYANARLIAAAPDMAACLEMFVMEHKAGMTQTKSTIAEASAILKRIKGEA